MEQQADYVIIGAGSAGCVLANRLSANPANKVTLIEAGGSDKGLFFRMPAGFFPLMTSGKGNWKFDSVPQPNLNNRNLYFPRGKVLGGSSSINGLVASRGNPGDYDLWAQRGNNGWSYAECLPYFRKIESYSHGTDSERGRDGPIQITRSPRETMNPLASRWLDAAKEAGFPFNDDPNGLDQYGVAQMQGNYANGTRQSASARYLDPISGRANLEIMTGVLVERVLFEGKKAVGIAARRKGKKFEVRANAEVILAGGTINSPQLLQLSGIGDPEDLSAYGIPLVHGLPGVGKGLKDHLAVAVKQEINQPISLLKDLAPHRALFGLLRYLMFKSGAPSVSALEAWGHLKSRDDIEWPDLQYYTVPIMYNDHGRDIIKRHGFMSVLCGLRPQSEGSIKINSADPSAHPDIDPNFLSDPEDLRVLRDGIRIARNIHQQSAFNDVRSDEYEPGAACQSDEELNAYIRRSANSLYHPVGTCRMGDDPMAVVDAKMRVHGVDGLRVVDASVMPEIISGNTNLPVMMMAERASEFITG